MHLLTVLSWLLSATLAQPATPKALPVPPSEGTYSPHSPEALRDLCRGRDLCWQTLRVANEGTILLEVKFMHESRFVAESDDVCDQREYWHIDAQGTRRLLTRDCEEQWGPDSQAPVSLSFDAHDRLQLSYLEWQTADRCEKTIASVDWKTARIVSLRRWIGQAKDSHSRCVNLRSFKEVLEIGQGTLASPMISFHKD